MVKPTSFLHFQVMLMLITLIIMLEVSKSQQGLELVPVGIRSSRNVYIFMHKMQFEISDFIPVFVQLLNPSPSILNNQKQKVLELHLFHNNYASMLENSSENIKLKLFFPKSARLFILLFPS